MDHKESMVSFLTHVQHLCDDENHSDNIVELSKRIHDIIENKTDNNIYSFIAILAGRLSEEHLILDNKSSAELWQNISSKAWHIWYSDS